MTSMPKWAPANPFVTQANKSISVRRSLAGFGRGGAGTATGFGTVEAGSAATTATAAKIHDAIGRFIVESDSSRITVTGGSSYPLFY